MATGIIQPGIRKAGTIYQLFIGFYGLLILVVIFLPFFSFPGTSIVKSSISQLGAQSAPNAWIMNLTLLFLGTGSLAAGWSSTGDSMIRRIFLALFSLFFSLTAFFNQEPFVSGIPYSVTEDGWHSYFACSAWISFMLFTLATAFVLEQRKERLIAAFMILTVLFLSILMAELEQWKGIWQRLITILSFGWMIRIFPQTKSINQPVNK